MKTSNLILNRFFLSLSLLLLIGVSQFSKADSSSSRIASDLKKLVKTIDKKDKAEAQVLLKKTRVSIDDKGYGQGQSYLAIYINSDEAARDYSQISVSFNSFYEDIKLDFANVLTDDGKLHPIQADATQIQSPVDENFYHDQKELLFSLPNVRKGSVIEFQYSYKDIKKIMPGQWFDSFSFLWWESRAAGQGARADRVLLSELEIVTDQTLPLYFNDASKYGVKLKKSNQGKSIKYEWSIKNLSEIKLQEYMQRDNQYAAYIRAGTVKSWSAIAGWADNLIEPHVKLDAKMQALVSEIQKNAKTPEDKVKAVYAAMQSKIRYVFAHVGRGGYEPHDAADVLKNGYGDCKDQTVFAVTTLRALGIQANPALVATRSRGIPDMSIPSVTFDHMIVHIPAQKGLSEIWMDTTGETSLFPGFSVGIEDQPALIVNQKTTEIVSLPALSPKDHNVSFRLTFEKPQGKNLTANFEFTFTGMYEQRLRSLWQYTPEREKYFRDLLKGIYSSAEVVSIEAANADNMWKGFTIKGTFLFSNVWDIEQQEMDYGFGITQLTNLFGDFRNLDKPENRKHRFVLNPGYSINADLIIQQPHNNYRPQVKFQGRNMENAYYRLAQSGMDQGSEYHIQQSLIVNTVDLSVKDYADYFQKMQELQETQDWRLSYGYDKTAANESLVAQSNSSSLDQQLLAIRSLIKKGQYQESLTLAKKVIAKSPKSGEAWHLLGLAQGYNEEFESSAQSFSKAESLGYLP